MAAIPVEIQYDKERKFFVDVAATLQKVTQEIQKENVRAIKLSAKGGDINRVSLVAIQFEEQEAGKWKISSMKVDHVT